MNLFRTNTEPHTLEFTKDIKLAHTNNFEAIQANDNSIWLIDADGTAHLATLEETVNVLSIAHPDGVPEELLPPIVLADMQTDEQLKSEFTEPGNLDYCIDCDINSKLKSIILARLNTDKVIDSESANILTKLYAMAYAG